MNQILAIEMDNKKIKNKNKPANIKSVVKFFTIVLAIFAVILIGIGGYSLYKNQKAKKDSPEPQIAMQNASADKVLLKVTHDKGIKEIIYKWNEEQEERIEGNNKNYVEKEIPIPSGENILTVKAIDVNGKTKISKQMYKLGDTQIAIEQSGTNAKISVTSKNTISYITYRWDEEEEVKLNVNDSKFEQEIEVKKGTHTLVVVAVDNNSSQTEKEITITVITKPKITAKLEEDKNYMINVIDDDGLKSVEYTLEDGTQHTEEVTESQKEYEFKIPLQRGSSNRVTIKAINIHDKETEKKVKCQLD